MVHNGIEYGVMAAYAEGLGILRDANAGKRAGTDYTAAQSRVPTSTISICRTSPKCGGAEASSHPGFSI
jgi:6-phosphogluconate dehydrogenase (decarboxylating)